MKNEKAYHHLGSVGVVLESTWNHFLFIFLAFGMHTYIILSIVDTLQLRIV